MIYVVQQQAKSGLIASTAAVNAGLLLAAGFSRQQARRAVITIFDAVLDSINGCGTVWQGVTARRHFHKHVKRCGGDVEMRYGWAVRAIGAPELRPTAA